MQIEMKGIRSKRNLRRIPKKSFHARNFQIAGRFKCPGGRCLFICVNLRHPRIPIANCDALRVL